MAVPSDCFLPEGHVIRFDTRPLVRLIADLAVIVGPS